MCQRGHLEQAIFQKWDTDSNLQS